MAKNASRTKTPPPIEGLPQGAVVDEDDLVFFVYEREASLTETFEKDYLENRFKTERREERDEIGLVKNGKFKPNSYYKKWKPTATSRPLHRWQSPKMRQDGYVKRYSGWHEFNHKLTPSVLADYDIKNRQLAGECVVGLSGYAADQLWTNGIAEALACGAYEGDADAAADLMNLVLGLWPKAAAASLTPDEALQTACSYEEQRFIGRAPFADGVRPLLERAGAKPGMLARFRDARADVAEARKTMILIDGPRGIALRTARGEPEILAVHVFEPPKAWTKEFLKSLVEALGGPHDPVYGLRGTMTAEDYNAVRNDRNFYAEAQWPSPIVEGCKKEFGTTTAFSLFAGFGQPAPAVTFPGSRLGEKSGWFQYTVVDCETRGRERMVRRMRPCDEYIRQSLKNPDLACPDDVKFWIVRNEAGELKRDHNKFQALFDDWRWETIAGPLSIPPDPAKEYEAIYLWQTAECLREPLEDMMASLEKEAGLVFTDAVTPEKEAAALAAALGAVILAKFRRQCERIERVCNSIRYGDDFLLWDHDTCYNILRGLAGTTLEEPESRWSGTVAELHLAVNYELIDVGYALGMSSDFFDSPEALMEKLSPAFLKDVARRFADPRKPLPAPPVVRDREAFTQPASLEHLDDFLAWIDRSRAKNPLSSLFMALSDAVKAYWGVSEKTMASRLAKRGFSPEEAQAMAQRLALSLTAAKRFAAQLKGEPLAHEAVAERLHYMDNYVRGLGPKGSCDSVQLFLRAMAGAIELAPEGKASAESLAWAKLARELAKN